MAFIHQIKSWLRLRKKEAPLVSVVLLLRAPLKLTEGRIRAAIVDAWGRDIREDANEYVVLKPPIGFVRFDEAIFLINNVSKPYVSEEYRKNQAAAEFKEIRQLKVVMEHKAFFTVDLMHPRDPRFRVKHAAYRRMCSLAANFVDGNCLGVSFPETGYLRPYDDELKTALKSDNPLKTISSLKEPPVLSISADDADLQAATSEARRRWPEFVSAFHGRRADQMFSVKAPFRDGEDVEWIWVDLSQICGETLEGKLGNAPVSLNNIRDGDSVTLPVSAVTDWIYTDGEKVVGGFSVAVLRRTTRE